MENELAAAASDGTAAVLIPIWLQELTIFFRNIAVIAIPFVLWFATQAVEKRRATLSLVRHLDRDTEDNKERLYKYRRYQEAKEKDPNTTTENPYEKFPEMFSFDSVIVLNFYEAICTEIQEGALYEHVLYRTIRNGVIGARDVVLARYSEHVGEDRSKNYTALTSIADRWKRRANSAGDGLAIKIPDGNNSN